jgi:hypothetical protein
VGTIAFDPRVTLLAGDMAADPAAS